MKRVMYLVMAALVSTVLVAPSAAAQGEQAQQALEDAQARVDQARQYMQSPDGQAALADARASMEQARDNLQQQGEQARENAQQALLQAQASVDQARQYMQSPEGQAALADARASLEQALQDAQAAVQGAVQEKKQEMTVKMEGTAPLPSSGGPAIGFSAVAAPAFALLVGGAVLGYAVLRRR
jgi:hypothetical protein